jgi:para-aminobenzoate synthetase component 1
MKQYSKDEAIEAMNSLGSNRIPFLFIIDFLMQSPIVIPLSEVDSSSILYNIQGNSNYTHRSVHQAQVLMEKYPVSFERYSAAFKHVEKNIKDGNSYLLNLTFPTRIEINKSLREIFFISNARYKLIIEDRFVVFSPESFVQINNGVIYS